MNSRIRDILGSTTLAITARAKELKDEGKDVVSFAAGEPDFDTPESIKIAAIKAIQDGFTKYTPSIGTLDLRQAICRKFKKDNQLTYAPNQVVVGCGAKHALFNAIMVLCDEGDEVLLPAPYWVSYPEMIKMAGAETVILPTTQEKNFCITAEQLKAAINRKTRLLILNSPSNPTGSVYSKSDLEAIAEVCVENGIWVISDEIYEKLIYTDEVYTSIASLSEEIYERTITINGMSKSYSMTGWRIGYAAGQEYVMDMIKRLQDHSTSNPCSISQKAALAALEMTDEELKVTATIYKKRRDFLMSLVDEIPEIRYIKPDGAFYLFCDFSKFGSSEDVAKNILNDVNVAMIPGDSFGAPGWMRLTFCASEERIKEGVDRIKTWIKNKG